ncbi:MAG: Maf family protein [Acholeplasmataceae bacterium]
MLILASKSARRIKLLQDAGFTFKVVESQVDEESVDITRPKELTLELAKLKAMSVAVMYPEDTVIGADTVVVYEDEILGKPKDEEDAYRMLKKLSGETHVVYTAVVIIQKDKIKTLLAEAEVSMKPITDFEIYNYIETGEPMDKAGSYAIQGEGGKLVDNYKGDFFTIVGLPLKDVVEALKEFSF